MATPLFPFSARGESVLFFDRYLATVSVADALSPKAAFHIAQLLLSEATATSELVQGDTMLLDHLQQCELKLIEALDFDLLSTTRFQWFAYLLRTAPPETTPELVNQMLAKLYASVDDVDTTLGNSLRDVSLSCIRDVLADT